MCVVVAHLGFSGTLPVGNRGELAEQFLWKKKIIFFFHRNLLTITNSTITNYTISCSPSEFMRVHILRRYILIEAGTKTFNISSFNRVMNLYGVTIKVHSQYRFFKSQFTTIDLTKLRLVCDRDIFLNLFTWKYFAFLQ